MPSGKVKFFNAEKGFGRLSNDEGEDVFFHRDDLPDGLTEVRPGTRVDYGIVSGKRGLRAMQIKVLDPVPSVVRNSRRPAEELAPLVEDLIKLLDGASNALRHGRYPADSGKIAGLMRAFGHGDRLTALAWGRAEAGRPQRRGGLLGVRPAACARSSSAPTAA